MIGLGLGVAKSLVRLASSIAIDLWDTISSAWESISTNWEDL